jgi:hypothetical protein
MRHAAARIPKGAGGLPTAISIALNEEVNRLIYLAVYDSYLWFQQDLNLRLHLYMVAL